jgi:hypothetical protein
MVSVGLALAAWLSRRRAAVVATPSSVAAAPLPPDSEALDRLKRALDEVDA